MRTRLLRILALIAMLVPLSMGVAAPAHADDDDNDVKSSWRIPEYTVVADTNADGTTRVKLDLAFDFAKDPGHGPFVTLPERMRVPNNPDQWRELPVKLESVTSSTGANTATMVKHENGHTVVRVGTKGKKFTGVQRYTITYTVRGIVQPGVDGADQLNWNALGPAWEVPVQKATATVTGPAAPQRTACFTGKDFRTPCQARVEDGKATFTVDNPGKKVGMQVVAAYPVGSFTPAAAPTFTKRYHLGNMFPLTPATGGATALFSAIALALVARRVRTKGRDEVYAGLTPGLSPTAGAETATKAAGRRTPVAVAFQPPKGARPGEIGTLIDGSADDKDVTATIIDLAVRGHLKIESHDKDDWTMSRRANGEPLLPYEKLVVDTLFQHGDQVTSADLRDPAYAPLMKDTPDQMYEHVTNARGWFAKNPKMARAGAVFLGMVLIAGGVALGFGLALFGWGLLGIAPVLAGVGVLATAAKMATRTAEGSAVQAQALGFRQYLTTAEADQIRFEEGVDIFSRYLPYAIMFGVAERWVKVFQELEAKGMYHPDTDWYVSPMGYYGFASMAGSMDALTSSMTDSLNSSVQALNESQAGSGSGFSGGGGFGGGGGGGW
ncbi:DUF2207 domain-containing protein [Mariniluteicoccus endophyticus]